MISTLESRGLFQDSTDRSELEKQFAAGPLTFYCGFDPTADSLHVGSMLPLLVMRRLQQNGHKPIALIGSATGMIGDPSGKSEERVLLDEATLQKNISGIRKQIEKFLSPEGENAVQLVQNDSWIAPLGCIEFLRDVGKHFSVNAMMAKDSVKSRLENREQGISYTEFSYMLLQAYDYYHLHREHNCQLQIGGSDQWGNITAGIELIRRRAAAEGTENASAHGLTFPLLTTASGAKFGKTERGAVWLDPARTSPYHFYQYWLNTADEDVVKFLLMFTDVDGAELDGLQAAVKNEPQQRAAQRYLAEQLTTLVHGADATTEAQQASQVLFGGSLENIKSETLKDIFSHVPSTELSSDQISGGMPLLELLITCNVAKSKGEARRLIDGGGLYLNNEKTTDQSASVSPEQFIDGELLVIRSGKKNYFLAKLGEA